MSDTAELVKEIKEVRDDIAKADKERLDTMDQLQKDIAAGSQTVKDVEAKLGRIVEDQAKNVEKYQSLETTINELAKKVNRPGTLDVKSEEAERKAAVGLLRMKHDLKIQKKDASHPFTYNDEDVDNALVAVKGLRSLLHSTDIGQLGENERKALSSFNMGSNGFILAPEMASTVLSCLEDVTDVTGIMSNMSISGPSVKFLVDNVRIDEAAWACETSCFANNPQADLQKGLGELELKPETLRYIVCATRDLLEDSSVNVESWMLGKVNWAFRNTIGKAVITGDGEGRPRGILDLRSGIQACETGEQTPAGQFTWQDLLLLKWQVPMQYHAGGRYLLNQNTFGKILTMSDATGRPIMIATPTDSGQFVINGSPVNVVTQYPDIAPGTTPVSFGNWSQTYMIVNRKAVTMQQDPYSASFCVLFKFESRVGGGIICANAARHLRIR